MTKLLEKIGAETLWVLETAGRMGVFLTRSLASLGRKPFKIEPVVRQVHFIGARSVFVILFTGLFTGMVLGLQGYYTLRKFGSEGFLGSAVALSLIRELGPVLTALMVIGRAGSAICAEIGIMRNSEQIDALECMAIDPFRYLIVPKMLAGVIAMPLLTAMFDVIGIFGGYLVGIGLFGINPGAYFQGMYTSVVWADIEMGLVKSLVFGLLMVWINACKGYYLHLERSGGFGAEGVSRTTTDAVVLSSVSVLVWDYLISAILL
ncbi:MAG: MlaE family lipid ABC transporter permease subunit [Desulfuromonadales bacterium]|jgi:phospholipid/cholesterol/gamma-HCH transport system permease protein